MVTSSAVVGSSAISRRGLHAIAMAIITRWFMPPDSWCGKSPRRLAAAGMPTCSSSSMERCARRLAVHPQMQPQRLRQLEADGEARVQAGGRLLEDHRDVARR